MMEGFKLFAGLDPETLQLMPKVSSFHDKKELNDLRDNMDDTKGTWLDRMKAVTHWIRECPRRTMAVVLAGNKFLLAIRSGTTAGYTDIDGDSYAAKTKKLSATLGATALSNFLVAVVSDIGQVYPGLHGLSNHPFFDNCTGPPSMVKRNRFMAFGKASLANIFKAMDSFGIEYDVKQEGLDREARPPAATGAGATDAGATGAGATDATATGAGATDATATGANGPVQLNLVCYLLQQKMASPKCILVCICYSCCTGLTPPLPFACHACQQRRRHT